MSDTPEAMSKVIQAARDLLDDLDYEHGWNWYFDQLRLAVMALDNVNTGT